jgi:hypothetical protein
MSANVYVGNSVVGQCGGGVAIDRKHCVWCMNQVTRKTLGPGEVFIHVLGRGAGVDCGYCLKGLLTSSKDAGNSGSFCSVQVPPHVRVVQEVG